MHTQTWHYLALGRLGIASSRLMYSALTRSELITFHHAALSGVRVMMSDETQDYGDVFTVARVLHRRTAQHSTHRFAYVYIRLELVYMLYYTVYVVVRIQAMPRH